MNMIHAEKLVYEYDKRDEEGNVIGTNRAIDGVDIDVPQGSFVAEIPSTFTPDGKYILFSASIQDPASSALFPTSAMTELYKVPATGGRTEQVLGTPAEAVCFDTVTVFILSTSTRLSLRSTRLLRLSRQLPRQVERSCLSLLKNKLRT